METTFDKFINSDPEQKALFEKEYNEFLSEERLAEIKAFKNTDFSDCLVLTAEQLAQMRPSHLRRKAKCESVKETANNRIESEP